jgi:hypothetical protein
MDAPPLIATRLCRLAQPFPMAGNMEIFWNPFVQKLAPIAAKGNRAPPTVYNANRDFNLVSR